MHRSTGNRELKTSQQGLRASVILIKARGHKNLLHVACASTAHFCTSGHADHAGYWQMCQVYEPIFTSLSPDRQLGKCEEVTHFVAEAVVCVLGNVLRNWGT